MPRRLAPLLMLFTATLASGQGSPLSVHAVGPDSAESHTREAVTFALEVGNAGSARRTVSLEAVLPDGWRPLIQTNPFTLQPAVSDVRIVSFLVPSRTPAGPYVVRYRVHDQADASVSAECGLSVVVLPEISLGVHVLESPSFVIAGKEYSVSFAITNSGNADAHTQIDVTSGASLPYEIQGLDQPPLATVPAGGAAEFRVAVRTDAHLRESMRHPLQVTVRIVPPDASAEAPSAAPVAVEARASSMVEVVPLSVDDSILTHTIPVDSQTTATAGYDQGFRGAIQQEIKARGTLDEAGEHRIELDVSKQLDTTYDPLFNPSDRYSVQYESRFGAARLGDLPYTLSPLLVQDELARGAQGTVNLFPIRLSALYFRDVWTDQGRQGLGGGVDFTVPRLGDWNDVLYRAGLDVLSPLDGHTTFDVLQQYNPAETLQFQADAALQTGASGDYTPAVLALSHGELDPFTWTARYVRAWPGFIGTYSDNQSILANAGVTLCDGLLKLHSLFNLSDSNLALSSSLPTADRTIEISLGGAGEIPTWKTKLGLDWETWRRIDRFPTPSYSTWDNILRLSARQPFTPITIGLQSSLDFGRDDQQDVSSLEQSHVVSVAYSPTDLSEYGVSLRYSGRLDSLGSLQNLIGADLSIRYALRQTQIEGQLSTAYIFSRDDPQELQVGGSARLVHTFPWAHRLMVRPDVWFISSGGKWTPTASMTVTYGASFDVPVSRKPNTAIVTGRVFNTATGAPMPGVILRLDDLAAMTDAKGAFTFYLPHAGTKFIQIDRRTVSTDLVPVRPMPLEVAAPSGSKVFVDIGVVEGCTVSGNVGEYGYTDQSNAYVPAEPAAPAAKPAPPGASPPAAVAPSPSGEPAEPERTRLRGLGNIVVELSDGTEIRRKLTGATGNFSFEEVRPGTYTLRIADGDLPEYSTIDPPGFTLALARGEKRTVDFRVLQERRRIKILESGQSINLGSTAEVKEGATIELPRAQNQTPNPGSGTQR